VRGGPCITNPIPTLRPRADLASALLGHARLARRREGGGSEEVGGDGSSEEGRRGPGMIGDCLEEYAGVSWAGFLRGGIEWEVF